MRNFPGKMLMLSAVVQLLAVSGSHASNYDEKVCADSFEKTLVREFYGVTRPGAVLPIPGRKLDLPESKVASALPPSQSLGTPGTSERFKKIWTSIDRWGANQNVGMVLTMGGWHAFNVPGHVPITQPNENDGFYDIYADDGDGVHGHIRPDLVDMIYAVKLPAPDGSFVRAVTFYADDGSLIFGMYASEAFKPVSPELVKSFDNTWNLMELLPRACKK